MIYPPVQSQLFTMISSGLGAQFGPLYRIAVQLDRLHRGHSKRHLSWAYPSGKVFIPQDHPKGIKQWIMTI